MASQGLFPPNSKKKQILLERCMRSEDEKWDKNLIPTLRMKCLQVLANNFAENPIIDELNDKDREVVLEMLPTTLPLAVQAKYIPEEAYWMRCCKAAGEVIDIKKYENSWRRAFIERHVQKCIQRFHPSTDDLDELMEQLKICQPFVKLLKIEQLWQKNKVNPVHLYYHNADEDEEDSENPLMPPEDCQCLQFTSVLSVLTNVTELDLSYSAKECGHNFAWNLFQITEKDCEDLGKALKDKPQLTIFRLRRSLVDDPRALTLLFALEGHQNLKILDLSHNKIENLGAKAISKLIKSLPALETFDIMNNKIGPEGAECLAHSISSHQTLKTFNISMNKLSDGGGVVLCRALCQNTVLQTVTMSMCLLGPETCRALGEMFTLNTSLQSLNLTNNQLGEEGGEALLAGLLENSVLLTLDVRMCQLGERLEYEISRQLKHNKHLDEPNYVLPRPYSSFVRAEGARSTEVSPRGDRSRTSGGDLTARSRGSVTSRTSATRKSSALSTRSAASRKSVRSLKQAVSKVTSKISETAK
ncbi:dynein regulatory complex subunit 5-like [Amphibalanus amphitrite]|uniref:dynein regulatory complex subunit 5-like n=1 Tax=Amphibalanus amphitrite TaxID=1232801 RepID=UPI001C917A3D|nr:dynein regulatory complex subunit 5-like [Amphibalanus amphitrite]